LKYSLRAEDKQKYFNKKFFRREKIREIFGRKETIWGIILE